MNSRLIEAARRIHLIVGVAGMVAFLGTGQYMDRFHGHLRGYDEVSRLLFRSTHIYLLLSALANALMGLYLTAAPARWRRILQLVGSAALLAAPTLFLAAFTTEPWLEGLARPWTRSAVYLAFAGTLAHLLAGIGLRAG